MTAKEVNGKVVDLIPANVEAATAFLKANRNDPDQIVEHLNNARPRPLVASLPQVSASPAGPGPGDLHRHAGQGRRGQGLRGHQRAGCRSSVQS